MLLLLAVQVSVSDWHAWLPWLDDDVEKASCDSFSLDVIMRFFQYSMLVCTFFKLFFKP